METYFDSSLLHFQLSFKSFAIDVILKFEFDSKIFFASLEISNIVLKLFLFLEIFLTLSFSIDCDFRWIPEYTRIELEIKFLKDYPEWHFLSQDELNRKTIEIHFDLKNAKRSCNKDQKVIKVPNTEVFKIVAPILLSRGISRIVSSDLLIAL